MSKIPSQYAELYSEEERRILRLNYSLYFTQSKSRVRDTANALKGKCRDEAGILKAYYPYQTHNGRPLKRFRDRATGNQIWKLIKITNPSALQVLTKCVYAFIDHKYGVEPKIEIHHEGDIVEGSTPILPSEKQPEKQLEQPQVPLTMTGIQIKNILGQIETGKVNRKQTYVCCEQVFASLYEFRKHLHEMHPVEMSSFFEVALHRELAPKPTKEEIHRLANKGKKKIENKKKKKELKLHARKRGMLPSPKPGDHFHIIYTPMGNKR